MNRQKCLYDKFTGMIDNYHFCYSNRREVDIHQSWLSDKWLLGVRVVALIYLSFIYVATLYAMPTFNTNLIYLTMIGYSLTWLYFVLSLQHYFLQSRCDLCPQLEKIIEIIYELAFCAEVPITIVFWTLLFKYVVDQPNATSSFIFVQTLFFLLLDAIFNSYQFHIRHITFLITLTVLYLAINLVYSLLVKPIYAPLTWVDIKSYILALGCVISVLVVHFIARLIYRKWKLDKLKQKDNYRHSVRESLIEEVQTRSISFEKAQDSDRQHSIGRKSVGR